MKPLVISAALTLSLSTLCSVANAAKLEDVAPYPKADAGFTRQVIRLPSQKNEEDYKVQIIAGKTLQVDCNQQRLTGKLQEKNLKGWGYPMYRLDKVSGPLSTMMACPDGKPHPDFVPVVGDGFMLRYNSKLPIVLYVPKGVEVRYRIWSASKQIKQATAE
ncbi:serine protease inhibitor ecotin [Pseudomonas sp. HY2-MNA-CIBAN-0224]|uniref:serine protease inhibitor ecotin n=1 Tax=Pseudomonas sp. HY2-MNA-CIBAN-0224 TaxID=3140471 RepID=UPI003323F1EA